MKIKAWDRKRKQFIPPKDFAITGDGRLVIAKNASLLLYPEGVFDGYWEQDGLSIDDVSVITTVEQAPY